MIIRRSLLALLVAGALAVPIAAAAYNYAGYRWGGSFPYVPVDQSNVYVNAWRDVTSGAMNDWNAQGARFVLYNWSSENDIYVAYDSSTDALAWATTRRQFMWWGNIVQANIWINSAKPFYPTNTSFWYDLRSVMRHELGHWLKLNHTSDPATLMYTSISPYQIKGISFDEYRAIRDIYGIR